METNETYKQKMMARLEKCDVEIYLLDLMAVDAYSDTKAKYTKELDILHAKKREAAKKIQELGYASVETWEKVKISANEVMEDLVSDIAHADIVFN